MKAWRLKGTDYIQKYLPGEEGYEGNVEDYESVSILTNEDLEKIARAALETGFAQGYSREGFGSKQEYEEYVEMKLSDFLQSSEYKELVGE